MYLKNTNGLPNKQGFSKKKINNTTTIRAILHKASLKLVLKKFNYMFNTFLVILAKLKENILCCILISQTNRYNCLFYKFYV